MKQPRKRKLIAKIKEEIKPILKQGLGDIVEVVFKATGIDKVAKFLLGEDCGCEERKEKLNNLFRGKKAKCLTEIEHTYLSTFFESKINSVKPSVQYELLKIHSRVFSVRNEPTSCADCLRWVVKELEAVYNEYKQDGL